MIALLGDDRGHRSHQELNALRPQLAAPFVGMHFCNYAPTAEAVGALEKAGVVVGATADDAGAEVLEFPDHPFYVTSMFQPHIDALAGAPVHPLVRAFVSAVAAR